MGSDFPTSDFQTKDTLYLHMGPGFNSYIERKLLGERLPQVEFWDQPLDIDMENPLQSLVDATIVKINTMAAKLDGPIHILAHSFGGQILEQVLRQSPDKIASAVVYNSCGDLRLGLLQVLASLEADPSTNSDLKKKIRQFLDSPVSELEPKDFVNHFVALLSEDPLYLRVYFSNLRQFESYINIAKDAPGIDVEVFKALLVDYIKNYSKLNSPYEGSKDLRIYLSSDDPFYTDNAAIVWKKKFPHAQLELKKSGGHFLHLEEVL